MSHTNPIYYQNLTIILMASQDYLTETSFVHTQKIKIKTIKSNQYNKIISL